MECMIFNVKDVQSYLGISQSGAYNLFHAQDFPAKRIGRKLVVLRTDFHKWLEQQQ